MAAFVVRGTRAGRPVTIRWDDGEFAGDPATVDAVLALIGAGAKVALPPVGPWVRASRRPGGPALLAALAVLDDVGRQVVDRTGDESEFDLDGVDVPDGAVA